MVGPKTGLIFVVGLKLAVLTVTTLCPDAKVTVCAVVLLATRIRFCDVATMKTGDPETVDEPEVMADLGKIRAPMG